MNIMNTLFNTKRLCIVCYICIFLLISLFIISGCDNKNEVKRTEGNSSLVITDIIMKTDKEGAYEQLGDTNMLVKFRLVQPDKSRFSDSYVYLYLPINQFLRIGQTIDISQLKYK